MRLSETIAKLIDNPHFITVSGGGGKTSLLMSLSRYYRRSEKTVLLTTTTKFQSPEMFDWGCDFYTSDFNEICSFSLDKPGILLFADKFEEDVRKWKSPSLDKLESLYKKFDVCVCEADGSKGRPFKIHTQRDPVIPSFTTYRIAVMGIWGIGQSTEDVVFGPSKDKIIDLDYLNDYIKNPEGLLKGGADCVVINGAEAANQNQIDLIKKASWPKGIKVIAGSVRNDSVTEIVQ